MFSSVQYKTQIQLRFHKVVSSAAKIRSYHFSFCFCCFYCLSMGFKWCGKLFADTDAQRLAVVLSIVFRPLVIWDSCCTCGLTAVVSVVVLATSHCRTYWSFLWLSPVHRAVEHSLLSEWWPWHAGTNRRGIGWVLTHFLWRTWMPTSSQSVVEQGPHSLQSVQ